MRKVLLIPFFILICLPINSQEVTQTLIDQLKIYINGSYEYQNETEIDTFLSSDYELYWTQEKFDIGDISIAIEINGKNAFKHEIELMPINFERNDEDHYLYYIPDNITTTRFGSGVWTSFQSAIRYQIGYYFNSNKLILPYIAISTQLSSDFIKSNV
jgi:hypothetical protein